MKWVVGDKVVCSESLARYRWWTAEKIYVIYEIRGAYIWLMDDEDEATNYPVGTKQWQSAHKKIHASGRRR